MERIPLVGSQKLTFYGRYDVFDQKLITFLLQLFVITSGIISSLSIMIVIQSRRQRIHESLCMFYNIGFLYPMVS